jgi:hypothetical protein
LFPLFTISSKLKSVRVITLPFFSIGKAYHLGPALVLMKLKKFIKMNSFEKLITSSCLFELNFKYLKEGKGPLSIFGSLWSFAFKILIRSLNFIIKYSFSQMGDSLRLNSLNKENTILRMHQNRRSGMYLHHLSQLNFQTKRLSQVELYQ